MSHRMLWPTSFFHTHHAQEEDAIGEVVVSRCELGCRSKYQKYFLGTLYGIHALLLVFGTFLAWETRKVKYRALSVKKINHVPGMPLRQSYRRFRFD